MLEELKNKVLEANLDLVKNNLVLLTWGNVSAIDRNENLVVIKPSGVDYKIMKPEDMVVVDLDGNIIEGSKKPSSDTPTHLELYKAFKSINGITHTHSTYATIFAQACREIPCLGTTHADNFHGSIPVTRFLTEAEVNENYEKNTGKVIIETLEKSNPEETPAVLVAGHASFTFGKSAHDSVVNSIVLEQVAKMAITTLQLNPNINDLPQYITDKHFFRKHGKNAYYGQK